MNEFMPNPMDRILVNVRLTLQRQKPASEMVWGGVTATWLKTPQNLMPLLMNIKD